jgi:hypothetical protein
MSSPSIVKPVTVLAFDDRLSGFGGDHTRQDRRPVTDRSDDASSIPITGDCLWSFRGRIVIQGCMPRRSKEHSVLFFLQVGGFLELQFEFDHEWVLGIVENRFVAAG